MQTRHFFAGSNSGEGFYSLFDYIIGSEAKKIYLLKGGPGTGKSSFMRYIAQEMGKAGYDHELFFCSSDSRALDAVCFPDLGVALLDATAPHAREPKWPGCRDQLLCLGDFWQGDILEAKREEIIAGGRIKQAHFASAFRYFAAALALEENMAARNGPNRRDCSEELEEILATVHGARPGYLGKPGLIRHLFASALTPEGYVSHLESLLAEISTLFVLAGGPGTGKSGYLQTIAQHVQGLGLDVEVFHYPLNPRKWLHLIIPALAMAVVTATDLEPLEDLPGPRVDCGGMQNPENAGDHGLWQELLHLGVHSLQQAQSSHLAVEEFYTRSMDFAALAAYRDQVLAEIMGYRNLS